MAPNGDDEPHASEVIVQGTFRVAAEARAAFLAESVEAMIGSRAEPGCLEYVLAADPVEADRVILSERWASPAALAEHLRVLGERRRAAAESRPAAAGVTVLSRDVAIYEVVSSRILG